MSITSNSESARVVKVAAGLESTEQQAPVRDARHEALGVLIGRWINEGHTIPTSEVPSSRIVTSDVYEWAPGGYFVVHSAYGKIGETSVGGVEIIGVDGAAYRSTFNDSFGNVHTSLVEIEGDMIRWLGERTRCTAKITDDGMTGRPSQVQHRRAHLDRVDGRHPAQDRVTMPPAPYASPSDFESGGVSMKYMLLIYDKADTRELFFGPDGMALGEEIEGLMAELTASGELVGGEALADPRRPARSDRRTACRS